MHSYLFIAYDRISLFVYGEGPAKAFTSDFYYRPNVAALILKSHPSEDIDPAVAREISAQAFNILRGNVAASDTIEMTGFLDGTLNAAVMEELSKTLVDAGFSSIIVNDQRDFIKRYAESIETDDVLVVNAGYSCVKLFHKRSGFVPVEVSEGICQIASRAIDVIAPPPAPDGDTSSRALRALESFKADAAGRYDHSIVIGASIRLAVYNAVNALKPRKIVLTGLMYETLSKIEFIRDKAGTLFDEDFVREYLDRIRAHDIAEANERENDIKKKEAMLLYDEAIKAAEYKEFEVAEGIVGTLTALAARQAEKSHHFRVYYEGLASDVVLAIEKAKGAEGGAAGAGTAETGEASRAGGAKAASQPADEAWFGARRPVGMLVVELALMAVLTVAYFTVMNRAVGPQEFAEFLEYWYLLPVAAVMIFMIDMAPVVGFPLLAVSVYMIVSGGRNVQYNPAFVLAAIPFAGHLTSSFMLYLRQPKNERLFHKSNIFHLALLSLLMTALTICGMAMFTFSGYMNRMVERCAESGSMKNTVRTVMVFSSEIWNPLVGSRTGTVNHGVEYYAGKLALASKGDEKAVSAGLIEASDRFALAVSNANNNYDMIASIFGGPTRFIMSEELDRLKASLAAREKAIMAEIEAKEAARAAFRLEKEKAEAARKAEELARIKAAETAEAEAKKAAAAEREKAAMAAMEASKKAANATAEVIAAIKSSEIELLKKALANVESLEFTDGAGWTPLALAVKASMASKSDGMVRAVLEKNGASPDAVNRNGWTPLSIAVAYRHYSAASALIEHGAAVDRKVVIRSTVAGAPDQEWTPLMLAVWSGNEEMAAMLVEKGANVEIKNEKGLTALDLVVKSGKISKKTLKLLEKTK